MKITSPIRSKNVHCACATHTFRASHCSIKLVSSTGQVDLRSVNAASNEPVRILSTNKLNSNKWNHTHNETQKTRSYSRLVKYVFDLMENVGHTYERRNASNVGNGLTYKANGDLWRFYHQIDAADFTRRDTNVGTERDPRSFQFNINPFAEFQLTNYMHSIWWKTSVTHTKEAMHPMLLTYKDNGDLWRFYHQIDAAEFTRWDTNVGTERDPWDFQCNMNPAAVFQLTD